LVDILVKKSTKILGAFIEKLYFYRTKIDVMDRRVVESEDFSFSRP